VKREDPVGDEPRRLWLRAASAAIAAMSLASAGAAAQSGEPAPGAGTTFPGPAGSLSAPSGAWTLVNRDREGEPPNHALLLVRDGAADAKTVLEYSRSVEVAWSEDSRWLLITEHRESDEASCILFEVDSGEVLDLLAKLRRDAAAYPWLANHHVYMRCRSWLGEGKVLVDVAGYGERDPGGFARRYRVDATQGAIEELSEVRPSR
jgi:hypothetical protein